MFTHNLSMSLYVILLDGKNKHILSWVELKDELFSKSQNLVYKCGRFDDELWTKRKQKLNWSTPTSFVLPNPTQK